MPKYRFTEIAINSTEKKKPTEADKETYIGLEHLDSGTLTVSRWGSEVAPIGEKLLMKKGDVLFGKRRAYQKKVGIAPFDGIFSAHGMVLRPREEVITKEYFPLFISSDYFLNEAIRISVGSLSPTVNWKDLKDLTFNIPTIEEQRRITPLVWSAIKAKNAYKTLIQSTDDLVKSQFIEMFVDKGFPQLTLSDISQSWQKGQAFKKDDMVPDGNNQCIHYGELFTKYGVFIEEVISKTHAEKARISEYGDILFPASDVTPLGLTKCSALLLSGVILGGDIIIMRPKAGNNSVYLSFAIRMEKEQLLSKITGSVVRHISAKGLQTVSIIVPPIKEQNRFEALIRQSDKSKFVVSNRNLSRCLVMV